MKKIALCIGLVIAGAFLWANYGDAAKAAIEQTQISVNVSKK